jgi:hypothetical protein
MLIRRIIGLAVVGWIVSMIAASIAALSVKRRLVPTTDEGADEIVAVSIFGPLTFHSTAQQFRGGSLDCWYGGGALDLRDAILAPGGATLRVRAIFGGGQILVPATWTVVSRVRGMGGLSDARPSMGRPADAPQLVIEGIMFAGGFAVMSELAEGEAQWLEKMTAKQTQEHEPEPEPEVVSEPEMAPAT